MIFNDSSRLKIHPCLCGLLCLCYRSISQLLTRLSTCLLFTFLVYFSLPKWSKPPNNKWETGPLELGFMMRGFVLSIWVSRRHLILKQLNTVLNLNSEFTEEGKTVLWQYGFSLWRRSKEKTVQLFFSNLFEFLSVLSTTTIICMHFSTSSKPFILGLWLNFMI